MNEYAVEELLIEAVVDSSLLTRGSYQVSIRRIAASRSMMVMVSQFVLEQSCRVMTIFKDALGALDKGAVVVAVQVS